MHNEEHEIETELSCMTPPAVGADAWQMLELQLLALEMVEEEALS